MQTGAHTHKHTHLHNMQILMHTNRQQINVPAHIYASTQINTHTFPDEREVSGRQNTVFLSLKVETLIKYAPTNSEG